MGNTSQASQRVTWSAGKLWRHFFKKKWPIYLFGFFTVVITGLCQVLVPRIIGWCVDFFEGKPIPLLFSRPDKTETFVLLVGALSTAAFFLMLSRMGWRITLARLSHRAGSWLRKMIWQHARFFSTDRLNRVFTVGHLMNASTSDSNYSKFIFGFTLIAASDVLFLGFFTLIAMFLISPEMTALCMLSFPIYPVLMKKLAQREMGRYSQAQEFLSKFNDQCSQAIATIRMQRLTQTGPYWVKKLEHAADQYRKKKLVAFFTSFRFFPLMGSATILFYLVLFGVGVFKVFSGSISIGDFIAFQSYALLIQDPLIELGFVISDLQRGRASLNRLTEVYNEPYSETLVQSGKNWHESENLLQVKQLSFKFDSQKEHLFSNFSLDIKRGSRLGIYGPIGSGKTTLVNLLTGLESNHEGQVLLSGRPISSYSHEELRKHMAVVPQKTFLFADTVRNNIRMDTEASDDEIWHHLETACVAEDVRNFPDQLDTKLGEWGINLSGGQKQRLTLARALLRKPRVLFLDDCISAVDTVTEEKILSQLDKELPNTTLIWVAPSVFNS